MLTLRIAAIVFLLYSFFRANRVLSFFFFNVRRVYSSVIDGTGTKRGDGASIGPEFFPSAQRVIAPLRQVSLYILEEVSDVYKSSVMED